MTGRAARPTPAARAVAAAAALGRPVFLATAAPQEGRSADGGSTADEAGPLTGMPFAVKDNIDVAGLPTTAGFPALGAPAARSARVVSRLVEAGAVPIGKTNMDQFATGLAGTRSPYGAPSCVDDPTRVSGGSSSGSAVAVAAGIVPFALGTDTAGSGRVPAAFNGLVGVKPTRGLISTRGVLPACRSLDCVTTLTRTVALAASVLAVAVGHDPQDPWSRPTPVQLPAGVARHLTAVGVPAAPPDLDDTSAVAWSRALRYAADLGLALVPVELSPFLEAARLLYAGPWVAERYAAVGHLLEDDAPGLDPTVRAIIRAGRDIPATDGFRALDRLAGLRQETGPVWQRVDALLLPVTPWHPTTAEVAADPVGTGIRLGTFTNFVNLLDLTAVAVPAGRRDDGLPFGVQLVAPAFADAPLLDLAARWCGEPGRPAAAPTGWQTVVAVGAHQSGLPFNHLLVERGGRLLRRARTAPGYRLLRVPGPGVPRPALVGGAGPPHGFAVEVWELPAQGLGELAAEVAAPLTLGPVTLADGTVHLGWLGRAELLAGAEDLGPVDGWRDAIGAQAR